MRALFALAASAALLSGCATSNVALLADEGVSTSGAVGVFDSKTETEIGALTAPNTVARLGGRKLRVTSLAEGAYSDLLSRVPYAPRTYVLYFVEGSTDLTPESAPILEALRKDITAVSEVQITGHSDTVGSAESNDALSRDRAVEIRAVLVRQGLPVAAARTTGRGERELRIPTADGVSEGGNRRVEVILR
jgi:outer membrane protein OmpA-like peptidoglycan-associated protein